MPSQADSTQVRSTGHGGGGGMAADPGSAAVPTRLQPSAEAAAAGQQVPLPSPVVESAEQRLHGHQSRSAAPSFRSSHRSGGGGAAPSVGNTPSPPPLWRRDTGDSAAGEPRSAAMEEMPMSTNRALHTYITEPPATLELLRQYAEEQLVLQDQAEAAGGGGGGVSNGHARAPSLTELLSQPMELSLAPPGRPRSASPFLDGAAAADLPGLASNGASNGVLTQQLPEAFMPRADLRTFSTLKRDSLAPPSPQATPKAAPAAARMARVDSGAGTGLRRRLGVQLLADPQAEERGVHNHRAAGDLFLSPIVKADADGFRLRPLPPDQAREVLSLDSGKLAARAARNLRRAEPLVRERRPDKDKDEEHSDEEEEMDLQFEEEEREVPYWRRRRFWVLSFWCLWSFVFLLVGALMAIFGLKNAMFRGWFDTWRMLIFIGLWPPIFWTGTLVGRATVWIVESRYLTNEAYLFYIWTVRRPLAWVVRAGLLLGSWAACLYDPAYGDPDESAAQSRFQRAYIIIVKILSCVLLFTVAELLKVLVAKMIASKFNRESHVKKMRAALKKEHYLHVLLQPRERPDWRGVKQEGEEGSDDGLDAKGKDEGDGDKAKTQPRRRRSRVMQLGMPSLSRLSAPGPGLQSSRSFRSMLSPSRLFSRSSRRLSAPAGDRDLGGLAPIDEAKEEEPASVTVQIGTPPATPASATAGRIGAGSPARQPFGGRNALNGGQPSPPKSPAKSVPVELGGGIQRQISTAAGLLRQGSTAPALLRHGSAAAALTRQGSLPHVASRLPPTPRQEGRTASTSTHNVNAEAGSPTKAPQRQQSKTLELLGGSSASSALQRGDVALAVKMNRVEKHIRKKALQVTFYDELSLSQRQEKVTTEIEAKRLAFFLFHNIKTDPDRPYLIIEDLESFMSEKSAQGAFAMLDLNANGRVSLPECAAAVMSVFKEREYLANSLRDTKMIVKKLGFMIGIGIHTVFFFIYLLILGINAWQVFVSMVPLLGAISFAVGSTVKQTVDASVFLFVTHPYDVGDIILFNDAWHRVEEITLPATVFLRTADSAKIWYPNSLLVNMPIQNVTMSPPLAEISAFIVDADTPATAADDLKHAVLKYTAERPSDFTNKVSTWFDLARDQTRPNKLALKISVEFAYNMLNARCFAARGALFHFMVQFLQSKGIEVCNTMQPVLLQQGLQGSPLGPAGLGPASFALGSGSIAGP
ncbi:hypothetical protein ABPG77_010615 [Micractinium sp. CCAP 211/92]